MVSVGELFEWMNVLQERIKVLQDEDGSITTLEMDVFLTGKFRCIVGRW